MRSVFLFFIAIFFIGEVFGGFARWLLNSIGADQLIYAPKIAILILILPAILIKNSVSKLSIYLFILVALVVGCLNYGIYYAFFSLFIMIPFLSALSMPYRISSFPRFYLITIFILWLASLIGIYWDYHYEVPWSGLLVETEFADIEGSREWTTQGIIRSTGFTRISHTAALIVALFAIQILMLTKSTTLKLIVSIISFLGIAMTTSKSTLIALLFVLPIIFCGSSRLLIRISIFSIATIQLVIFLFVLSPDLREVIRPTDVLQSLLYGSLYIRLDETWPQYIDLIIINSGIGELTWLTGGGLGATGAAQKIFGQNVVLADSSLLYAWGSFGVLGILFIILLYRVAYIGLISGNIVYRVLATQLTMLLVIGITTDIWESSFALLLMGFSLSCYLGRTKNDILRSI